jgi:hypothetical protein
MLVATYRAYSDALFASWRLAVSTRMAQGHDLWQGDMGSYWVANAIGCMGASSVHSLPSSMSYERKSRGRRVIWWYPMALDVLRHAMLALLLPR